MKKKTEVQHRNRFEGQIANAAHNNPGRALALATYGPGADNVMASFERNPPTGFRCLTKDGLSESGVSDLIQQLLFLDDCREDATLLSDPKVASKQGEQLEIELGQFVRNLITTRDSQNIRRLADILDAAIQNYEAAKSQTFEAAKSPKFPYQARLLLSKAQGVAANLSSLADEMAETLHPTAEEPKAIAEGLAWHYDKDTHRANSYRQFARLAKRKFAKALSGHAVCDLSKPLLDAFVQAMDSASPKARNHHRAGIKQFLQWCVRNDYLSQSNRLLEADSMRMEHANNGEVGIYTAKEFRALLEMAEAPLQPLLAIAGFCGLRTAELLRLEWEDVQRVEGHIEISQTKSKTRSRRLVTICPALAEWLRPYRQCTGKLWHLSENSFHAHCAELCKTAAIKRKDNGLRHSFCSFHFALHVNENSTAAQAGNSPTMIHAHYKGLATKAEAENWFAVAPAQKDNVLSMKEEIA